MQCSLSVVSSCIRYGLRYPLQPLEVGSLAGPDCAQLFFLVVNKDVECVACPPPCHISPAPTHLTFACGPSPSNSNDPASGYPVMFILHESALPVALRGAATSGDRSAAVDKVGDAKHT